MPKLGLTMTQGVVAKWLVENEQEVEQGQPVVIVMSAKITQEIEAPAPGTVQIVAQQDQTCPVGEAIGAILAPGEAIFIRGMASMIHCKESRKLIRRMSWCCSATA